MSALRGVALGFSYPLAITMVGFFILEGYLQYQRNAAENLKILQDRVDEVEAYTKAAEAKMEPIKDIKERLNSAESKLALMNSTRRTM